METTNQASNQATKTCWKWFYFFSTEKEKYFSSSRGPMESLEMRMVR